ncbi:anoctamin-3-like isoform X2 [Choristoneura fumiferana]|uniref:anoctamin-3-like isoform X2 n=1 Tax=Choristoneura fumiferana TaxID=7141 RepID=UPI003D1559D7
MSVNDTGDNYIVNDICKNKTEYMCPRCNVFPACRFSRISNFCKLAKIHKVLDGPYVLHYGVFLAVWATSLCVLWKRKESFWKWLWEINTDEVRESFRPEYSMKYTIKPRSRRTGVMQNYTTGFEKYGRALVVTVLCGALYGAPVLMLVPLFEHKQKTDINLMKDKVVSQRNEDIAFIVIFAIKLVIIQIIGELIYRIPVHYITKLVENHRTYECYARAFALKTFLAAFMLTFPILFYYAWVKGLEYFLPVRLESYAKRDVFLERRGQFSFTHCGPFTCLDEVFFVLLATILIKYMAMPFAVYLKGLIINTLTDYNQCAVITKDAPSWEREYRLETVTEVMMARKLTVLMMQFALVTLVGVAFPLAPLLLLIRNFCDIRYEARMFVQCRRRPLLLDTALGVWTPVLQHLALLSVPSIALTLARATKAVPRKVYMDSNGSMKGYLFYSMYRMPTQAYYFFNGTYWDNFHIEYMYMQGYIKNYSKHNFVPKFCHSPGLFEVFNKNKTNQVIYLALYADELALKQEYHLVSFGKYYLYFVFSVAGLLYAALLEVAFPAYSREVG